MITIEDLKNLATIPGPCLTIVEPVRDPVLQVTKAATRLTAATQEADRLLVKKGLDAGNRGRFLDPIRKFAENTDWAARTGSVVIFRASGFTQATFVPDFLESRVTLGEDFMILPLLVSLAAERNYWVLGLSINKIHLLRGKGPHFTEVDLPADLPRSLADFMGFEKPDHNPEARSAKGPSSVALAPETEAAHLHDYFKAINRAIHPILTKEGGDPLVLAAVPRELALYRTVNTYAPLLAESIHGSPDALGFERLHKTALQLVAGHGMRVMENHGREIDLAASRKLLVTDPAAIDTAAAGGRIARLFINRANLAAGEEGGEEQINRAALTVLRNSGAVVCCEGPVPTGGVAAVLRYRAAEDTQPELAAAAGTN